MCLWLAEAFPGQALYSANHCADVAGAGEEGGELLLSKKIVCKLFVRNTVLLFALTTEGTSRFVKSFLLCFRCEITPR